MTIRRQYTPEQQRAYRRAMIVVAVGAGGFVLSVVTGNLLPFAIAPLSMIAMIGGLIAASVIAKGWAGAGFVLDAERARKELEPTAALHGAVVADAVRSTELGDALARKLDAGGTDDVRVRCRSCRALNDEDAKFCDQCTAAL